MARGPGNARFRRTRGLLLVPMLALGGLVGTPAAHAASTLHVDPATGLTDGQIVTLTWSGLAASNYQLYQCDGIPQGGKCGYLGVTTGLGTSGSTSVAVQATYTPDGGWPPGTLVDCEAAGTQCSMTLIGPGPLGGFASYQTPISFSASVAAPTVTAVAPASGPDLGGTTVVVTGTDFTGATAVDFGATPAADFTVNTPTKITATSPPHAAAPVAVSVTTPGGTSSLPAAFEFTPTTPAACTPACITVGDKAMLEMDRSHGQQFSVTLSEPADHIVTVDYMIVSDTAAGGPKPSFGLDFQTRSGTLTWKPTLGTGLTGISKTINARVLGDFTVEADETFSVLLSNPTGGYVVGPGTATGSCVATPGCATGTILDDDLASDLALGVGDGSVFSARDGKQSLRIPVTLAAKAPTTVTVDFVVTPGTATHSKKAADGGDFGGKLVGTLTFAPGATIKQIVLPIWADPIADPDGTVTVHLSNPNGNGTGVAIMRDTGSGNVLALD